jgi:hypothetical protein
VLPQYGTNRSIEELVARTQGFIDADPLGAIKNILDIDLRRAQIREANARTEGLGQEKLSPLEKNLRTLQRLGIPVTDAQVKSMAGIDTGKLSPERDAQLKVLIETSKDIPPGDTKSRESISAAVSKLFADQASEARLTEAVAGLQQAQRTGVLPEAIATLRQQNIPEDAIAGLARAAGVPYTPPPGGPAPAAATTPAQPGLQRQPTQLLQPLFDLQRWSRTQTELSNQNFNPYDTGGLR